MNNPGIFLTAILIPLTWAREIIMFVVMTIIEVYRLFADLGVTGGDLSAGKGSGIQAAKDFTGGVREAIDETKQAMDQPAEFK